MATEAQTFISDKEYKASGASICPKCKSDQIEGGSFDVDSNHCTQELACLDCNFEWVDQYTLTGYGHFRGEELEGKTPTPQARLAVVLDGGLVHQVLTDMDEQVEVLIYDCDRPDSDYPELGDWEEEMAALAELRKEDNMRDIQ
jgi:hypothetical protein